MFLNQWWSVELYAVFWWLSLSMDLFLCLYKAHIIEDFSEFKLSKDVFEYVSTKREAHKISKVCFLKLFKLRAFKSHWFCQKRSLSTFPPSGQLTKWTKSAFLCFSRSFRAFKSPHFCQKRSLGTFSQSGQLTKWTKSAF